MIFMIFNIIPGGLLDTADSWKKNSKIMEEVMQCIELVYNDFIKFKIRKFGINDKVIWKMVITVNSRQLEIIIP